MDIIRQYSINIQNFRIIRQLGHGGFGQVFEVENMARQRFAAKVIQNSNNEAQQHRILMEIALMINTSSSPMIARIQGFSLYDFHGNRNLTILMDMYENGSLDKLIRNKSPLLDNTAKLIIIMGIATGMEKLHRNNIIHRDLKPENILIDKYMYPHISDFGLSKCWEDGQTNYQSIICGTNGYMAPEIQFGSYNNSVDVYAFGFIIYELLTGVRACINPKLPMPKCYRDLIERCWSFQPEKRPTFMEILFLLPRPEFELDNIDLSRIDQFGDHIRRYNNANQLQGGNQQGGYQQGGNQQGGYQQGGYPQGGYQQGGYQQRGYPQRGNQQGGYQQGGYQQGGNQQRGYPQGGY